MITFTEELTLDQRRELLTKFLRELHCEVTFTKVNGERRVMPCTLREDVIPPRPVHVTNTDNPIDFPKIKKENPNVMSVWCTDKESWRSFRLDSVETITVIEGK